MQQHPIPQNVTQYQFRLVGDMTLKQFLELVLGLLLAYMFFASNLIFIFKWPLIILSILFGVGLAFFPIEDRPLDQWIINFLKAIYNPTRFIWKKSDKIPSIFTFEAHALPPSNTITKTIKAPTITNSKSTSQDLSDEEMSRVNSLDSLFSSAPPTPSSVAPAAPDLQSKPSVSIRKLHAPTDTTTPPIKPQIAQPVIKTPTVIDQPEKSMPSQTVPETLIFSKDTVVKQAPPKLSTDSTPLKSVSLPVAPKAPNLIVGVATASNGKLVEGAIVQIVDSTGLPARAMKTNALGQFATSTPLSPGKYIIEIDSSDHSFTPREININNTIVPPFEIRATQ